MTEHTPTPECESPCTYGPLTISGRRTKDGNFIIKGVSDYGHLFDLAEIQYKPHAAYIVKAVNCHDELVEALKAAVKAMSDVDGGLCIPHCVEQQCQEALLHTGVKP